MSRYRYLKDLHFTPRFEQLGSVFVHPVRPTPLANPHMIHFNHNLCELLALTDSPDLQKEVLGYCSGHHIIPNTHPFATYYSGHQFGAYNPQLGDGRAIMLGEITTQDHQKWEFQLKGSGPTPFSRMGDGRAVLRSTIREYLASEALFHLNIPTTRALCLIGSSEKVYRETTETAAALIRVSPSHLRFGHFEYFYYTKQYEALNQLLQFVIHTYFPEIHLEQNPAQALFFSICQSTATLLAKWQGYGFQHGVMNTDNMSILGLTLDYGPFAFMDDFNYFSVCNHSDHSGRYSFDQQPSVAAWNLQALGQVFSYWLSIDIIKEGLELYRVTFEESYLSLMHQKVGLLHTASPETVYALIGLLHQHQIDYTCFFRALCDFSWPIQQPFLESCQQKSPAFHQWFADYHEKRTQQPHALLDINNQMKAVNPCYILRNYLAQKAITEATHGDFSELDRLMSILQNPFTEQTGQEGYAAPAPSWGKKLAVSCSS
jgi:serine/tyrosine/threonine adenylyltransferase